MKNQVINLAEYRARVTGEGIRFDTEEYHDMIDGLRQVRIYWSGDLLEMHFDAASQPEVARRIAKDSGWGMAFFGIVGFISQPRNVRAEVDHVYRCEVLRRPDKMRGRQVLVVTFRTACRAPKKTIVGRKEMSRHPASFVFR